MSKRFKSALCVMFSAMFIFLAVTIPATPAGAVDEATQNTIDSYNDKIEDLNNQIAQNEKQIAEFENQKKSTQIDLNKLVQQVNALESEINALNQKISLLNASIAQLNNQITATQNEIDKLQVQINDQQLKIDDTYSLLKKRLRAMYMAGDTSSLEILMGSDSFETLLTRLELVKCISQHDTDLIETMKNEIKSLQSMQSTLTAKQTQLTASKQQLEAKKADLVSSKTTLTTRKSALDKTVTQMSSKLNSLNSKSKELKAASAKLEARKSSFEDYVADLLAGRTSTGDGNVGALWWPLNYPKTIITSPYGMRTLNGTTKYHYGIDITVAGAAQLNKRLQASAAGRVVFAGYNSGGYGYYIIIDHGHGVETVYGHCNQLLVSEGAYVAQGDTIAILGSTGYSTGPHVHYEVRINGNSNENKKNPMNYVTVPSDVRYNY